MKNVDLGQMVNTLANLGVIAGILLLAFEVRQAYRATELQAAQSYMSMAHELDFRLVDDPSTFPLVFAAPEDLSPVDRFRQGRWHLGVLRTWENGYYLNQRGVLNDGLWAGQEALIMDVLNLEPLRGYIERYRSYLSDPFITYLDSLREAGDE